MPSFDKSSVLKANNNTIAKDLKSNHADVELKTIVPDGGWGWVVCCSCLFGNMTMGGIFMSYGILLPNLKENFQQGTVIISFIGSIMVESNDLHWIFTPKEVFAKVTAPIDISY